MSAWNTRRSRHDTSVHAPGPTSIFRSRLIRLDAGADGQGNWAGKPWGNPEGDEIPNFCPVAPYHVLGVLTLGTPGERGFIPVAPRIRIRIRVSLSLQPSTTGQSSLVQLRKKPQPSPNQAQPSSDQTSFSQAQLQLGSAKLSPPATSQTFYSGKTSGTTLNRIVDRQTVVI